MWEILGEQMQNFRWSLGDITLLPTSSHLDFCNPDPITLEMRTLKTAPHFDMGSNFKKTVLIPFLSHPMILLHQVLALRLLVLLGHPFYSGSSSSEFQMRAGPWKLPHLTGTVWATAPLLKITKKMLSEGLFLALLIQRHLITPALIYLGVGEKWVNKHGTLRNRSASSSKLLTWLLVSAFQDLQRNLRFNLELLIHKADYHSELFYIGTLIRYINASVI